MGGMEKQQPPRSRTPRRTDSARWPEDMAKRAQTSFNKTVAQEIEANSPCRSATQAASDSATADAMRIKPEKVFPGEGHPHSAVASSEDQAYDTVDRYLAPALTWSRLWLAFDGHVLYDSTASLCKLLTHADLTYSFCKQLGAFWDAFYARYEACTVRAQHQADAEGPESGRGNWIASAEWVAMRAGFLDVEYSSPLSVTELQSRVCWNYLEVNVRRVLAKLPLDGSGPYKLLFLAALSNDCALTPYMHVLSRTRPNCDLPCGLTGLLPLAVQRFAAMKSCLQSSPSQMRVPMYELIRDPITIGGTLAQFLLPTPNPMTSTMLFTALDASAREKMIAEHVVCIVDHIRKTLGLGLAECVQALNAYIYAAPLAASVFEHL
ncbi:hypothetical protein EV122DRAFT_292973 [Schizophyllum commune]